MNKLTFAIDVGSTHSGFVILEEIGKIHRMVNKTTFGKVDNQEILELVDIWAKHCHFAIEYPYPKNNVVAYEVFVMSEWVGRIMQRLDDLGASYSRIYRHREKSVMCRSGSANDAQVRAAVIAVYGHKGTKDEPGPTYGISNDVWQAIAVGTTYLKEGDSEVREKEARALKKVIPKPKIKI